jgi:hypothetical protein
VDDRSITSEAPPYEEEPDKSYNERKSVAVKAIKALNQKERLEMIDEAFAEDLDF